MAQKTKKMKAPFREVSQAHKRHYGKRWEADFIHEIKKAEKISELVPMYCLGIAVATRWKTFSDPEFTDWAKLNGMIEEKWGFDAMDSLKGFAKTMFNGYGLGHDSKDAQRLESAVGGILRNFAQQNA